MIRFKIVAGPVAFGPGQLIGLTEAQAKARRHNVEVVKAGKTVTVVRLAAPQQFKTGEEILLDEQPKHLAGHLEDLDAPVRAAAEAKKKEADDAAAKARAATEAASGAASAGTGQPAAGLI